MRIADVKAIITGGASGLGHATARRLAGKGARVCIWDLDTEKGREAAEDLDCLFLETDIRLPEQVDHAARQSLEHMRGLNVAINCAGIAPSEKVLGKDKILSTESFERCIQINLVGTFNVCRAAALAMKDNPSSHANSAEPADSEHQSENQHERGVIINTASIAAYEGQAGQAAYAASKGGVASMTLPLAREFARHRIRVMTIAPGLFQTPMLEALPAKAIEALAESIPFPSRPGRPREFADLVLHIITNPMLNGTTLRIDGALRM